MLAYHFGRSDDKEKTLEYIELSNCKAAKLYALQDAMGYFEAAMVLLDTLPDTGPRRLLRLSLLVSNSFVFQLLDKFPDYYALLLKYEPTALALDSPGLLGGFYARKGHCEWHFGCLDEALETAKKAIDLTEACGNVFDAGYAYCLSQWILYYKSSYENSLALKEKVIRSHKKVFFLRIYVWSLCAASMVYTHLGQWEEALREGESSLKVAGEYSDDSLLSFAAWVTSQACCNKGEISKAIEYGNLAVRKASSPVDYLWSRINLGWVLCRAGEPEKDLEYLIRSVQKFRKAKAHLFSVYFGVMLGEGHFLNQQYDKAKQELESTLKLAEEIGMKFWAAWCHCLLGEISIATDPTQEKRPSAETCFENAISICLEIKAENLLAKAYAGLGRYYKLKGNVPVAKDYLNQALEIFERLGTLLEPDKVRKKLAELSGA